MRAHIPPGPPENPICFPPAKCKTSARSHCSGKVPFFCFSHFNLSIQPYNWFHFHAGTDSNSSNLVFLELSALWFLVFLSGRCFPWRRGTEQRSSESTGTPWRASVRLYLPRQLVRAGQLLRWWVHLFFVQSALLMLLLALKIQDLLGMDSFFSCNLFQSSNHFSGH